MRSTLPATLVLLAMVAADSTVFADGKARTKADAAPSNDPEQVALAFVGEHHPELGKLLEQLKAMRPGEYKRAISELYQVSRSLSDLKQRNVRRYEVGLGAWKARSKAELIAAKLASSPSPELESQLRSAVEDQLDAELRVQDVEREQAEARLRKVEESIKRLKSDRNKWIDSRFQVLKKKAERARRLDPDKSAPAKPAGRKKESKA